MAFRCPSELGSAPTIEGARNLLSPRPDSAAPLLEGAEPGESGSGTEAFQEGTTWRLSVVRAAVTGAGHTAPGRSTAARPRPVPTAVRAPTGRTGLTPGASCASSGGEPTRASSGRPNSPSYSDRTRSAGTYGSKYFFPALLPSLWTSQASGIGRGQADPMQGTGCLPKNSTSLPFDNLAPARPPSMATS